MNKNNQKPKKRSSGKSSKSKGRSKKGLRGTQGTAERAMSMSKALADTGKRTGGMMLGVLLSSGVGYAFDKIEGLKPNEADSKIKAFLKKAVKPGTNIILGAATSTLARSKKMEFVANIGDGMIITGGVQTVKALGSKISIFNGLGAIEGGDGVGNTEYYQEQLSALAKALEENGKVINLKGLEENIEGLNDRVIIPGTEIKYSQANLIV